MPKSKPKKLENTLVSTLHVQSTHQVELFSFPEVYVYASICFITKTMTFIVSCFNDHICFSTLEEALAHAQHQHELLQ